jgi:hypothetical protein
LIHLVDKEHFVSLKYSLIQKEKNKEIDDIQFYDRNKLNYFFECIKNTKIRKVEEDKQKWRNPFLRTGLFFQFFFMRGLPLKDNDHYLFPTVTTRAKTWLMSLKVLATRKSENRSWGI